MVLIQQKGDSIPGSGWNHEICTKRRVKNAWSKTAKFRNTWRTYGPRFLQSYGKTSLRHNKFEFYIRLSKHVNGETFRIVECFKNNPPKDLAGISSSLLKIVGWPSVFLSTVNHESNEWLNTMLVVRNVYIFLPLSVSTMRGVSIIS
jgi:hypothetical protein